MRLFFTTALVFIACVGVARADDLWATAVAGRRTDDWKIIYRFIEKLEVPSENVAYPIAVTVTWRYHGPNGLPAKSDTDSIYKFEDIIDERVEKLGQGKLVLVSTGNNLRTWTYYVKAEAPFRKTLAEALSAVHLQAEISSRADPGWLQFENFKKRVRKP